jgi:hypothetical protein
MQSRSEIGGAEDILNLWLLAGLTDIGREI